MLKKIATVTYLFNDDAAAGGDDDDIEPKILYTLQWSSSPDILHTEHMILSLSYNKWLHVQHLMYDV